MKVTPAQILVAAIILIVGTAFLTGRIDLEQFMAAVGVAWGLGSGHGLSRDNHDPEQ